MHVVRSNRPLRRCFHDRQTANTNVNEYQREHTFKKVTIRNQYTYNYEEKICRNLYYVP